METTYIKDYDVIKTISGIDTLYYFYESNNEYDNLFLDIIDQHGDAKARFEKRFLSYENKDIRISIKNQAFLFNGQSMGFYWFTHADSLFTIGFKDHLTNKGLNDIQVQFNAIGIYTLGIKSLLKWVDDLLEGYITGYKPLTRVDLNSFVQMNLSWINKDLFVARKRSYTSIFKEVANKHEMQTLYVGRKPFLLRIYNKKEELKNSHKKDLMYNYFIIKGFEYNEDDIFNIEFELHRDYFKTFKIDTVDDLLSRAELLFKDCMNAIRLVNPSSITDNTKDSKNKNRAETNRVWTHISDSYKLDDFLTIDSILERVKRKNYTYSIEDAIKEHTELARKAYLYNIIIDSQFYDEVLEAFNRSRRPKSVSVPQKKEETVQIVYENINEQVDITELDNLELDKYINKLEKNMEDQDLDIHLLLKNYQLAIIEKKSRGFFAQEFSF